MADTTAATDAFIQKWTGVVASELSTSQSFLIELCQLLGVDTPHPTPEQDYMFERPITFVHGDGSTSAGRIDLYRRGAFVLESKKVKAATHTKGFDDALLRARSQAEAYARALPADQGRPPFVVVVDVGHRIELYAEFSRSGATYTPYPDPSSHRIKLEDIRRPEILDRLRRLWTDPLSLDPSREAARVTRQIAGKLAELARSLEESGNDPEAVAQFLQRALFTMFAEDVGLLPANAFRDLLAKHSDNPEVALQMLAALWRDMDTGGFSAVLANKVLRFNGKLFKVPNVLPLTKVQLQALLEAAKADWRHVEPAIFGTLLERALSPSERHKLGAHYTPRSYVERLVLPTVIEPLRAEWSAAYAAALTLTAEDKTKEAVAELLHFHHRLCSVRVLDPACGSSNFLYVALEHLKRLEGEVLNALDELGYRQSGLDLDAKRADIAAGETVDPHNLLGIEINPRAAALAELVLWIGYLQWHFRTRGDVNPPEPVVRDFRNIENRDAVLAYDRVEPLTDDQGVPVTVWDGITMKVSPVTGEPVPDEAARKPLLRYVNPRKATWPAADFVVGNPPFIGNKRMRSALGDGYAEALRASWPDIPETSDFVMYWWHHAAELLREGQLERFGLITTNSISMTFNRRVLANHLAAKKNPLRLVYAIPDHPWVDASDGAAVRISMTVAEPGGASAGLAGRLHEVQSERPGPEHEVLVELSERRGVIQQDLSAGANVAGATPLRSNQGISFMGVILVGAGFVVQPGDPLVDLEPGAVKPYLNGRDLVQLRRNVWVVDFYGLDEATARSQFPAAFQRVHDRVRPERLHVKRESHRRDWWLFGEKRPAMRDALKGLHRYIGTTETAKFRTFLFIEAKMLPDQKIRVIADDRAETLAVLSSAVHERWASAAGARMGVGNDLVYNNTTCFEPFPFPDLSSESDTFRPKLAELAEQLDAHRACQQALHPSLTITSMYNVLEKLRSGEPLTEVDRTTHDQALVSVLRALHDEIDVVTLESYGWSDLLPLLRVAHGNDVAPHGLTQEQAADRFNDAVLERLVVLNAERAAEEAKGLVRWLRPETQNAGSTVPVQGEMEDAVVDETTAPKATGGKATPWPKNTVDQVRAVADLLVSSPAPLSLEDIGSRFSARGPWKKRLPQLLDMLVAVGRAEMTPSGAFAARK